MIFKFILGLFLSVVLYVIWWAYSMGEFNDFNSSNIDKCNRITTSKPCEDVDQLSSGFFILGCDNLKEYIHFGQGYSPLNWLERIIEVTEKKGQGSLMILSEDEKKLQLVPITGYQAVDFHPHGIASIHIENIDWIYVINHRRDGDFVSIFNAKYSANKKLESFEFYADLRNSDWIITNDVTVIPESNGMFYVTNWMRHDPGNFEGFKDIIRKSKWSHILVCGENQNIINLNKNHSRDPFIIDVNCRTVASNISGANGITYVPKQELIFVAGSTEHAVHVYHRDSISNNLTYSHSIDTIFACDNLNVDFSSNDVYASCYPKPLGFLYASMTYPKGRSASQFIRIIAPEYTSYDIVFNSNGEVISTSSAVKVSNGTAVASSLHDFGLSVCHDLK